MQVAPPKDGLESNQRKRTETIMRDRKIAVNQLTKLEISTIKQFVLADEWKHWSLRSVYYLMIRESSCHIHLSALQDLE